jgi:hypothetical protein
VSGQAEDPKAEPAGRGTAGLLANLPSAIFVNNPSVFILPLLRQIT